MVQRSGTQLAEIEREVETLQALRSSFTTRFHDVVYREDAVCVVLELYRGGDMMRGMLRHGKSKGPIPVAAVRHLSQQMWQAVAFLHSRSHVHCDVKAQNFMMDLPQVE